MSRAQRLLDLIQILRSHRYPVRGTQVAAELDISLRTLYRDGKGQTSQRMIWPFALGYFEHVWVLIAWCEQRQEMRQCRGDRIVSFEVYPQRYPRRCQALLKERREIEDNTTDRN